MNHHSQRILAPGTLRKRKEREPMLSGAEVDAARKPAGPTAPAEASSHPEFDNRILASYMAYEFLTRGTLLGQKLNNGRTEADRVSLPGPSSETHTNEIKESRSYTELACILKMEGVHIPMIINPTELAGWIQM
ncbi:hypothetical protein SAY87_010896 [Trapa incisa]|uniref:Uncharacterized protein n=1 Tax=Trapa incisa TaxID=236973 RepID=A0AAN7GVD7_9MYRT|nr:hypothetical protein SAY87_010896 [Trapa incisa]